MVICVDKKICLCDEVSFFSEKYKSEVEGVVTKLFRDGRDYLNNFNNFAIVEIINEYDEFSKQIVSLNDKINIIEKSNFMETNEISNLNIFPDENYFIINHDRKSIFGGFMVGLEYDYKKNLVNVSYLVNEVSQNALAYAKQKGFSYYKNNHKFYFDDFYQRDNELFTHISLFTAKFIDEIIYQDENFIKSVTLDNISCVSNFPIYVNFNKGNIDS